MPWRRLSLLVLAFVCIGSLFINGCATPGSSRSTETPSPGPPDQPGKIRPLRIQELVVPQADLNQYPTLADARVGAGLSQLLVDALTATGRFDLMAPPGELALHLSQTWGPTPEGLSMQATLDTAREPSAFRLSAKLFDIVACQPLRRLASAQPQASCRSSIGVQLRIEAPSGQFVPGATHPLAPQGRYIHPEHLSLFGASDVAFSQSAVGAATAKAIQYALFQAIERLDRQGW